MVSACWPSNTVGAFFVALLIIDTIYGNFIDLPFHAIVGIILTCVFWLLCSTFGVGISGAVLLVPAIVVVVIICNTIFTHLTGIDDCGCDVCRKKRFIVHLKKKPTPKCEEKTKPKPKCVQN